MDPCHGSLLHIWGYHTHSCAHEVLRVSAFPRGVLHVFRTDIDVCMIRCLFCCCVRGERRTHSKQEEQAFIFHVITSGTYDTYSSTRGMVHMCMHVVQQYRYAAAAVCSPVCQPGLHSSTYMAEARMIATHEATRESMLTFTSCHTWHKQSRCYRVFCTLPH